MATAYELQVIKELGDVDEARRSYPEAGVFIDEEEARLRAILATLQAKPRKFILAHGEYEAVEKYLGFGGSIVWTQEADNIMRTQQFIIEVPAEHAEWQSNRLASGLHGGTVYNTLEEARARL